MHLRPRSLRGRLVLLFVLGTAVAIGTSSLAIYVTLNAQIDRAVNDGLSTRADDIVGSLELTKPQIREDDAFAVVLNPDGTVVAAASTIVDPAAVLTTDQLGRAAVAPISIDGAVAGLGRHARLLAQPDDIGGRRVIVITGAALDTEVAARQRLVFVLLLGSPVLVVILGAGAWLVTTAALRPVRRIIRDADEISRVDATRRLPVPATGELAQLVRTLNAMLGRLAASFQRERAFVDDASHELRTPIAILRGELELAIDSTDVEELRRTVTSSLEETIRLADLADGLLVLARSGADGMQLRPEPIDLVPMISGVALRTQRADRRVIEVHVSGGATAMADPRPTEQIVANILDNARRFARRRIEVAVAEDAGLARIVIADDGPGFPESFLATAFERFSQADPARRRTGGVGLGLAIVAELTFAQHGTVLARNGPPLGGAVVELVLPATASGSSDARV